MGPAKSWGLARAGGWANPASCSKGGFPGHRLLWGLRTRSEEGAARTGAWSLQATMPPWPPQKHRPGSQHCTAPIVPSLCLHCQPPGPTPTDVLITAPATVIRTAACFLHCSAEPLLSLGHLWDHLGTPPSAHQPPPGREGGKTMPDLQGCGHVTRPQQPPRWCLHLPWVTANAGCCLHRKALPEGGARGMTALLQSALPQRPGLGAPPARAAAAPEEAAVS